jgi:hypothetical protein
MAVQSCKMSQKILHYTHYMGPMNHTMSEPDDGPDRPRLLPLSPLWIIEKQVCELRARVRIRKPRATGNCERPAMASLAPSLHLPWYASSSPLLSSTFLPIPLSRRHGYELWDRLFQFSFLPHFLERTTCCDSTVVGHAFLPRRVLRMDLLRFFLPRTGIFPSITGRLPTYSSLLRQQIGETWW